MIKQDILTDLYLNKGLSMMEIATQLGCSHNQVVYWMGKYGIKRRSISDAVYQRRNPNGNPFVVQSIDTLAKAELFGLGMGLYWGEGTKASKYAVRLGNTDPALLRTFTRFLVELFHVDQTKLKYGLQIFTDIDENEALKYWCKELGAESSQFYKIHKTVSGSIGTYRYKSRYGVVTVYFHNKKLRDIIIGLLPR
jgi:hypothetical protein